MKKTTKKKKRKRCGSRTVPMREGKKAPPKVPTVSLVSSTDRQNKPPAPTAKHGHSALRFRPFKRRPPQPNRRAATRHLSFSTQKSSHGKSLPTHLKPKTLARSLLHPLSSRSTAAPASLDWHCLRCRGSCAVLVPLSFSLRNLLSFTNPVSTLHSLESYFRPNL